MTSGAELIGDTLKCADVGCVFGVPGSQNIALFDALRRCGIRTVLASSEAAAGFMAIGWYRASGRLGVFSAIGGPGFAFAVPPLAEAALDASSVLLVSGQGPGRGRHLDLQEIDQDAIATALGAAQRSASEPGELGVAAAEAIRATSERGPRPALLTHSKRALESAVPGPVQTETPASVAADELPKDLGRAIAACRRPLILAGAAALDAAGEVHSFAARLGAAVTTTPSARGLLAESDQRVIAADFVCDDVGAFNRFVGDCDLVLAIGCRFSHNGTGGFGLRLPPEKLVHVHPDPAVLGTNYPAKWQIRSGVAEFVGKAADVCGESAPGRGFSAADIARYRAKILTRSGDKGEPDWPALGMSGAVPLIGSIRQALPDDGILVTDTGNHQIYARRYFEVRRPRGLVCPTDFQSMGFGLPAAIGAAIAEPDRPVVALLGDGGLLMTSAELATLARERVPLTVVVLADGYLGQIRAQQIESGLDDSMTRLEMPDLGKLATSYGIDYRLANEAFADQLAAAIASGLPSVIEVRAADSPRLRGRRTFARMKRRIREALPRASGTGGR